MDREERVAPARVRRYIPYEIDAAWWVEGTGELSLTCIDSCVCVCVSGCLLGGGFGALMIACCVESQNYSSVQAADYWKFF